MKKNTVPRPADEGAVPRAKPAFDMIQEVAQKILIIVPLGKTYYQVYQDLSTAGPLLYLRKIDRQKDLRVVSVAKYQVPHGASRALSTIDATYRPRLRKPNFFRTTPNRAQCLRCQVKLYEWDLQDHLDTHETLDTYVSKPEKKPGKCRLKVGHLNRP